ncbi:unnamed protein product [Adineta steineri]|uniref:Uncharacterized protein n=1 Tax=Adineta steineri TaxID=433720 RepID=A0A818PS81_9BILA|nr:unnamed protein product [Adineta steineri]
MHFLLLNLLLLYISYIYGDSSGGGGGHNANMPISTFPINDLGLIFGHKVNKQDNVVTIYFDVSNSTLKEYRYYYFDFRPFGTFSSNSEYLPRQRLIDIHNSLRIVGLHDGDYVTCLTFVDEYETISKPRYACYEFTLGEKTVGSHHGSKSGYLAPLLIAFAFVLHVFIAIVHHIKAKNYAQKLLHRFIDVSPKSNKRRININHTLKELDRELDHTHVSASVQRRLSRVAIDVDDNNEFNHGGNYLADDRNDEIPLYTLTHHNGRLNSHTMQVIPEYEQSNTLDSVSSVRHLLDSSPWLTNGNRSYHHHP